MNAIEALRRGAAIEQLMGFFQTLPTEAPIIVTQVKNEAACLGEWLAYHSILGFENFIVFDNDSVDATPFLLHAARKHLNVAVVAWPRLNNDEMPQFSAFETVLGAARHARVANWALFSDVDEFLCLGEGASIQSFLRRYPDCGGVAFNWLIFGSNGHESRPEGLTIEAYTRRAPVEFGANRHTKSVVRLDRVRRHLSNSHYFELLPDTRYVFPSGRTFPMGFSFDAESAFEVGNTEEDTRIAAIFHYIVKSRSDWLDKQSKGRNAAALSDPGIRLAGEHFRIHDQNQIEDLRLAGAGPAVAARMRELELEPSGGAAAAVR